MRVCTIAGTPSPSRQNETSGAALHKEDAKVLFKSG